jgi:hypothetical protein
MGGKSTWSLRAQFSTGPMTSQTPDTPHKRSPGPLLLLVVFHTTSPTLNNVLERLTELRNMCTYIYSFIKAKGTSQTQSKELTHRVRSGALLSTGTHYPPSLRCGCTQGDTRGPAGAIQPFMSLGCLSEGFPTASLAQGFGGASSGSTGEGGEGSGTSSTFLQLAPEGQGPASPL